MKSELWYINIMPVEMLECCLNDLRFCIYVLRAWTLAPEGLCCYRALWRICWSVFFLSLFVLWRELNPVLG